MKIFFSLVFLLCSALAHAQDALLTNRATELREAPDADAKVLQTLPDKSPVQLVERRGAWSQVKAGAATGWVRMMHLRGSVVVSGTDTTAGGGTLSGFNRLLGGNRTDNNVRSRNATLGVRGLSAEELKTASPNAQELAKMVANRANRPVAEKFAKEAPVTKVDVAELATNDKGGRK